MDLKVLLKGLGFLGIGMAYILFVLVMLAGAWIISTFISEYLNLTGLNWWIVTLFVFLVLIGIFNKVR